MKSNLPKLEVMEDGSIFSSGDVTKRDVFDLNFTSNQPITALDLRSCPMTAYRDRGLVDATTKAERVHSSSVSLSQNVKWFKSSNLQSFHTTATSVGSGASASKVSMGLDPRGGPLPGKEGRITWSYPSKIHIPANTPFSIELLFERHFAASLGRFRISATSSANQPRVSKIGVEAERILSLKNGRTAGLVYTAIPLPRKSIPGETRPYPPGNRPKEHAMDLECKREPAPGNSLFLETIRP